MSVWLPVKMSSWDRQSTYLVCYAVSSLIIHFRYNLSIVVSRCVFKRGIDPCVFPTFRVYRHTSHISSRRCTYDLIANSILGATILSIAVRIAFCILSSTVSTILFISLSILSLKHLSRVFTFIAFQLSTELSLKVPTVKSRSFEPSLTTIFSCLSLAALPITKS